MPATQTFQCENCGNKIEDAPMRIGKCLECGGEMLAAAEASDQPDPKGTPDLVANSQPSAPEQLPKYVREPVARQSPESLRDLAAWAEDLADWKEQRAAAAVDEPPEVAEDQERVDDEDVDLDAVDLDELDVAASVNIYPLKIPCGPGCDGCPHGPYLYAKWRDGDTVRTKYVGKP